MIAKVVVEHLENRKRVPRVWGLLFQHGVQIDTEQRPERLSVIDHGVGEPRESLYHGNIHTQGGSKMK